MQDFKKILALIDFSHVSKHTAEEAALIASKFNSELHLLHVSPGSAPPYLSLPGTYFFRTRETDEELYRLNKYKLEKIKIELENRYSLSVRTHEEKGSLMEIVKNCIHRLQINLVVVGARKKTGLKEIIFGSVANSIIRLVKTEVLCINPESNCKKLKKIVIPVGEFIPKRKIRLAYELARKFAANIHLITLGKNVNSNGENYNALMSTYRYIRDLTNIPIECKTVAGNNLAEATLRYVEKIGADLILINPGMESKLSGWVGEIVNHSTIPVLSVHPIVNYTGQFINQYGIKKFSNENEMDRIKNI